MVDADPDQLPEPPFDRAGRDGYRTPMQWDGSSTGGFTDGTPWLPLVDPAARNVADQAADPGSLLHCYRRLIAARRTSPALRHGIHRALFGVAPDVLAWMRETDDERVLCLVNIGSTPRTCDLSRLRHESAEVMVGTSGRSGRIGLEQLELAPGEGLALHLDGRP